MPKHITQVADEIADAIEDGKGYTVPFDGLEGITLTGRDEFTGTASFEFTDAECTDPGTYRLTVQRVGGGPQ